MATLTIFTTLSFLLLLKVISASCCQASTDCERCVMENGCVFIQVTSGRLMCIEKSKILSFPVKKTASTPDRCVRIMGSKVYGSGIPNSVTSADIQSKSKVSYPPTQSSPTTVIIWPPLPLPTSPSRPISTLPRPPLIVPITTPTTIIYPITTGSTLDFSSGPLETHVLPTLTLSAPRSSSSLPIAHNQPFLTPTPLAPKVVPNIRQKHPIVHPTPLETGRTLYSSSTSSNPIYALPKPYTIASQTPTPTKPPIPYITTIGSTPIYIPRADETTTSTPPTNFTLSTNVIKSTADEPVQTVSTTSMQDVTSFSVPGSANTPSTEVTTMESPPMVSSNRVNPYQSPTVDKQIPVVSDVDFKTPITVDFGYKCFFKDGIFVENENDKLERILCNSYKHTHKFTLRYKNIPLRDWNNYNPMSKRPMRCRFLRRHFKACKEKQSHFVFNKVVRT